MLFQICSRNFRADTAIVNRAYLIEDAWDDWFTYTTMFALQFVDNNEDIHCLGSVKIGEFGMGEGQRSPNLPREFEQLDDRFFSLGQDDLYYENLNKLGADIRSDILKSLNDLALKEELFARALNESVTTKSLLRDISVTTVRGQFRRIANGGARLTEYNFIYTAPKDEMASSEPMRLSFQVTPESNPPTNIHVLIGRNGVGKTHLIKNMIKSLMKNNEQDLRTGIFSSNDSKKNRHLFANIVLVAFSAFDEFSPIKISNSEKESLPYIHIGLTQDNSDPDGNLIQKNPSLLTEEFVESLKICVLGAKKEMWCKAVTILESDPIFKEADIKSLASIKNEKELKAIAANLYKNLSSGHKIIILTITRLIETVEEKTLVFLDEPEGHLHPPLLSAFIRALSDLLITRNGVAIIATHSPVILQEVPRSCVWKLRRIGREAIGERLEIESFGENIGALTNEVFGLEVTYSGFHNILLDAVKKTGNYDRIVRQFNGELGMEAKAIIKGLLATYEQEENK